ncbi:MAG: lipoate--protein ligase family protein [Candidatus Protochlamydia sp.]|nr:lipoate--protein ligase family protein [Candidatus Protochlamydia sp.]
MEKLNLVRLHQIPILQQLKWEEALLRSDRRNWCLINQGSPPAIVMGISGEVQELICKERLAREAVPLIRRFSGGGTVIVDENTLFVTFIFNASFFSFSPYPQQIMEWTEKLYSPVFNPHPFKLRENDYVIGQKKIGGNAQSIVKNRWLHHSTFLWDYSSALMDYLLIPLKMPNYREKRGHADFLCRLKDYWQDSKQFHAALHGRLQAQFDLQELPVDELLAAAELPHRQATKIIEF